MSGRNIGVQALVKQIAPQADCHHCHSHSCNLVIIKSVQCTKFGRNFFIVLQQLFVVIEGSAKRQNWFMEIQQSQNLTPRTLNGLSDTRWNCQGRSVESVSCRLRAVIETLEKIEDESSDRKVIGES
jgi:hypothetical protein